MRTNWRRMLLIIGFLCPLVAWGHGKQHTRTLVVNGRSGNASILLIHGGTYVELGALASIGNGSVAYRGDQILLSLPSSETNHPESAREEKQSEFGFSPDFVKAAIEEMSLLREWASSLANAIQNGFPVNSSWVATYREKATDGLTLASLAASTSADKSALQLLTNESENVRAWTNTLVEARTSMNAAKYSLSPNALREDPMSQKIITCAHFLATMLTSGNFFDDPSCH